MPLGHLHGPPWIRLRSMNTSSSARKGESSRATQPRANVSRAICPAPCMPWGSSEGEGGPAGRQGRGEGVSAGWNAGHASRSSQSSASSPGATQSTQRLRDPIVGSQTSCQASNWARACSAVIGAGWGGAGGCKHRGHDDSETIFGFLEDSRLNLRTILNTPAPSIQKRTWPTPSPDCGSSAGSSVRHASSRTPTSGTKGCKSPSILAGAMPGPRERIREEELLAASCAHTGCIPASLGSVGAEMATGVSHTGGVGALVPWMSGLKLKSEAEPG